MLWGDMDPNYWGLLCVPIGILVCFSPALIAAVLTKPGLPDGVVAKEKENKH